MKKKERFKNNKGITLIALVITIVVLIILASISVGVLFGDHGLIAEARSAKKDQEYTTKYEQMRLAVTNAIMSNRGASKTKVLNSLLNSLDNSKITNVEQKGNVAIINYDDIEYRVSLNTGSVDTGSQDVDVWDGESKSTGLVGEGTSVKPYLIRSAADLMYMSEQIARWANITGLTENETANGCDIRANDAYYKLVKDLSFENTDNFLPIGTIMDNGSKRSGQFWQGTFDGNNHEISNVKIYDDESRKLGFFYSVEMATVKNLMLTNIDFKAIDGIGGIVGSLWPSSSYPTKPVIKNCYVSGKLSSTCFLDTSREHYYSESYEIGGITGYTSGCVTIEDCVVDVEILGNKYVGGIVGKTVNYNNLDLDGIYESGLKIINCKASGSIVAHARVGGLVGEGVGFYANNCESNMNITTVEKPQPTDQLDSLTSAYLGGLFGIIDGRSIIENCKNTGNMTINSETLVVGSLYGQGYAADLKNCYNTGNIVCRNKVTSLGGLFGYYYADLNSTINCHSIGNVTMDTSKTISYCGKQIGTLHGQNIQDFTLGESNNYTGTYTPERQSIGRYYPD